MDPRGKKISFQIPARTQQPKEHPIADSCLCFCHLALPKKCLKNCQCKCSAYQLDQANKQGILEDKGLYAKPKLNTLIKKEEEIKVVEKMRANPIKSTGDLTPRSKQTVQKKMTEKMNFVPEEIVYKNLVPINVNDIDLQPKFGENNRKQNVEKSETEEPELADFYTPVPELEIELPVPEIKVFHLSPLFDDLDNYEATFGA